MVRFDSSAIWQAKYDANERLLHLWFTGDDKPYGYRDVPEEARARILQGQAPMLDELATKRGLA